MKLIKIKDSIYRIVSKKYRNKKDAEEMLEAMIRMSEEPPRPPRLSDFANTIYALAIATYALAITTSSLRDTLQTETFIKDEVY